MSDDIYHFEPAETIHAGHSLKEKETAVYKLAGFIERRYRNAEDGSPEPYWAYVERGARETGLESAESAESLEARLRGDRLTQAGTKQVGAIRRIFFGLRTRDGAVIEKDSVLEIVASRFPTFTATETTGYYQGEPEPTLVIEIAAPGGPPLDALARDLADAFDQDAVGIETNGVYMRVFGARRRMDQPLAGEDRKKLNQFLQSLRDGRTFKDLNADLQAWWLNRY